MSTAKPKTFMADQYGHAVVSCSECGFKRRVNVSKYRGLDKVFSIQCVCGEQLMCRFRYPKETDTAASGDDASSSGRTIPTLNVRNDGLVLIKCPGCQTESLSNVSRYIGRKKTYSVKCSCGREHSFKLRYPKQITPNRKPQEQEAPSSADETPGKADPLVFKPDAQGNCEIRCPNCNTARPLPRHMAHTPNKIFAVSCKCGMNFSFRISESDPPPPPPRIEGMDDLISVTSAGDDLMRAIEGGDPLVLRETFRPAPIEEEGGPAGFAQLRNMLEKTKAEAAKQTPAKADIPEVDIPEVDAELLPELEIPEDILLSNRSAGTRTDPSPEVENAIVEEQGVDVEAQAIQAQAQAMQPGGDTDRDETGGQDQATPPAAGRIYEQDRPIIFFPNSKGITRIICPECEFEKQVNAESFRKIKGPVGIQCKCGLQFTCRIEFREVYRKDTMLAGEYVKKRDHESGRFMIRNISMGGVGLRIIGPHTIHPGDVLFIHFTLDNAMGTEIRKTVKVVHSSGQDMGCAFVDKNFAQDIGYYLMA